MDESLVVKDEVDEDAQDEIGGRKMEEVEEDEFRR